MPKAKKETKKEKVVGVAKASPKAKSEEPKYIVSLTYNGQTEVLKGNDLINMFDEWSPRVFKTVLLVSAESGKQKVERRLSVIQAKRIAGNYTNAQIFAHNLLKFLNG